MDKKFKLKKNLLIAILSSIAALGLAVALIVILGGKGGDGDKCVHSFGEWGVKTAATCTADGIDERACQKCGQTESRPSSALGHVPAEAIRENEKAPTCTVAGSCDEVVKCSRCSVELERKTVTLEVAAHTESEYWVVCCEATCTSEGEVYTECTKCGEILERKKTPIKDHTAVTVPGKAPTCTETGLTDRVQCSECRTIIEDHVEIPTVPHTEVTIQGKAPTCTEDGLTDGKKCTVCGTITVAQTVIAATGHSALTDEPIPPTCTESGMTAQTVCITCGKVLNEGTVIPANGHSYTDQYDESCNVCGFIRDAACPHTQLVIITGTPATCTANGLTDGKKCAKCDEIIIAQQTIYATGHSEIVITGYSATCTENGLSDGKKCTKCGTVTVPQRVIYSTGHSEITLTGYAASCTVNGLTDGKKCTTCGNVTVEQTVIVASGHVEITIYGYASTCTENGLTDGKKCTTCGEVTVEQTVIIALGHIEVAVPGYNATCTENGLTGGKKCSTCGTVTVAQTIIVATGHTTVAVIGYPATCTENGLTDGTKCSICGTFTVPQTIITAPGHNEIDVPGTPVSCTVNGLTDGKKCTVCGIFTVEQTVIYAGGHNQNGQKEENRVGSTCSVAGSYDLVIYCTVCGQEQSRTTKPLPLADHSYGNWAVESKPTCEGTGTNVRECSVCHGKDYSTTDALGHIWSETYSTDAEKHWKTCTRDNCQSTSSLSVHSGGTATCKELAICTVCNSSYGALLPHDFTKSIIEDPYINTPASCTKSATYFYACSMCNMVGNESYTFGSPLGHEGGEATCTTKPICSRCFTEYGEPLGHNYVNDVCTRCGLGHVSEGLLFELSNDKTYYKVVGIGTCSDTVIVIPQTHLGLPVKEIGERAFGNTKITRINIPEGVTKIGNEAFMYCRSLTSINMPSTLTEIGRYAFLECTALKTLVIPESVTVIGFGALDDCISLETITLPMPCRTDSGDMVTFRNLYGGTRDYDVSHPISKSIKTIIISKADTITADAFYGCGSVTKIVIPDNVKVIDGSAFYGCYSLVDFKIPSSVTTIYGYAFYGCSSLVELEIPSSVTTINGYAFYGCSSLRSLIIPSTIESIGSRAFEGCSSLAYSELDGVKYLGNADNPYLVLVKNENTNIVKFEILEQTRIVMDRAFEYCNNLMSVTVSKNTLEIGEYAFYCEKLYEVYNLSSLEIVKGEYTHGCIAYHAKDVHKDASIPSIIGIADDFLFLLIDGEYYVMDYLGSKTDLVFPDSYNGQRYSIYKEAFQNRDNITSLTFSSGINSIGEWTFANCNNIRSITVPNGVSSIGQGAFAYCYSLESLTVPFIGQNADVGENAFIGYIFGNSSDDWNRASRVPETLKTVIITGGEKIANEAFKYCYNIVTIILPDTIKSIGNSAFEDCDALQNINIPNGVKAIQNRTFYSCQALKTITLPDSVTEIGDYAFAYTGITEAPINNIALIGSYAFYGCYSITEVTIPNGFTKIEPGTFGSCQNLKSVILPTSVTEIGEYAFHACLRLESIDLSNIVILGKNAFGSCESLTSVDISSVRSLGEYAFVACTSLKRIEFTVLESAQYGAFASCTSLTYADLGNHLTSIPNSMFSSCTALEIVYISDCVTSFGVNVFDYCTSLKYNEYDGASYIGSKTSPYIVLIKHNDTNATSVDIPDTVKFICNHAFNGYAKLERVTGGNGLIHIGTQAFYNASKLREFNFGSKLEYIGDKSFYRTAIQSVILPDSVTEIGTYAFYYCQSLTTVVIGSGIKAISEAAFYHCSSLTSLDLGKVEVLDSESFACCTSLATVTIPETLICFRGTAFYDCTNLKSAVFEDNSGWYYTYKKTQYGNTKTYTVKLDLSTPEKAASEIIKLSNYIIYNS